uniref:RNA helicase n=1 Tax=Panagrellus redivivus TaxID=6233 RepID=A0A7E4VU49_PANRE
MPDSTTEDPPATYKWLYVPFLMDVTTFADYKALSQVDDRFSQFIPGRELRLTWRNDLAFLVFNLRRANKLVNDVDAFEAWLDCALEKNPGSPLSDYDINFGLIRKNIDNRLYQKLLDGRKAHALMNKLSCLLDVWAVFEKMDTDNRFPEIVTTLRLLFENRRDNLLETYKARSLMMLGLLTFEDTLNFSWYNEFLRLLATTSSHTRPIARILEPDFAEIVATYETILHQLIITENEKDANFAPAEEPDAPRLQKDFETTTIDKHPAEKMQLRHYQHELANKALTGKGTIICAPTGSGKTVIAGYIIRDYVRRCRLLEHRYRVVFFVPTILLVDQQAANLRKLLGEELHVTSLSGAESAGLKENMLEILAGDVVVMTPQIFINLYKSPLAKKKIYIRDFTLMIFDECHHCDKKHPYNVIMQIVLNLREKEPTKPTPQVVGLTASVGVGALSVKAESGDAAVNHIVGVCARMGVLSVSCVKHPENLMELKQMVPKPIDEFITVFPPSVDPFARAIAELADQIQERFTLYHEAVAGDKAETDRLPTVQSTGSKNGSSKTSVQYGNKLAALASLVKHSNLSTEDKVYARWLLDYLKILYNTLKYNELYPALAALEHLRCSQRTIVEQLADFLSKGQKYAAKMRQIYESVQTRIRHIEDTGLVQDPADKNCLNRLLQEVNTQYKRDANSRILIFVDLRRGAFDLSLFLNHHEQIISTFGSDKVSALMSCSKQGESFTVPSRKEQAERRTAFEQGKLNIVVSTSVCEEGVDVAACNLVIKYNSVGSEKTYIQRRGRARAECSRSVLIALGSEAEKREYLNMYREHVMERCLAMLAEMDDLTVQKMIEDDRKRQKALDDGDQQRRNAPTAIVDQQIRCPGCSVLLGSTDALRTLDDETVVLFNPALWDKMKMDKLTKFDSNFTSVMKCSWASCAKCSHRWGTLIKYADCFFIAPRLDGISINGIHNVYKGDMKDKWATLIRTQICVKPLSRTELIAMYNSIFGQKENEMETALQANLKMLASHKKGHVVEHE